MQSLITKAARSRNWAVVGASKDQSKFGNKIFRDLKQKGYNVYGINPGGGDIDGQPLHKDLTDIKDVDYKDLVVDVVVPPKAALSVVQKCRDLGVGTIWLQPGAESGEVVDWCDENGVDVIFQKCAMVETPMKFQGKL